MGGEQGFQDLLCLGFKTSFVSLTLLQTFNAEHKSSTPSERESEKCAGL